MNHRIVGVLLSWAMLVAIGSASSDAIAGTWHSTTGVAKFLAKDRMTGSTYVVGGDNETFYKWNSSTSSWDAAGGASPSVIGGNGVGSSFQVNNGVAFYTRAYGLFPVIYSWNVSGSGTEHSRYGDLIVGAFGTSDGTSTSVDIMALGGDDRVYLYNYGSNSFSEPNSSARAHQISYDQYLADWFVVNSNGDTFYSVDKGTGWTQITGCASIISSDSHWIQGCTGTPPNIFKVSGGSWTSVTASVSGVTVKAFTTNSSSSSAPTAPEFAIDSSGGIWHWY